MQTLRFCPWIYGAALVFGAFIPAAADQSSSNNKRRLPKYRTLIVDMDAKGVVITKEGMLLKSKIEIKKYLAKQYKRLTPKPSNKEVERRVILRANSNATYEDVYRFLVLCEEVGCKRWQLRVRMDSKNHNKS
jgi:hypothetical protein